MDNNILLEAGTGEVELLEFEVKGKNYTINVIKVREVIEVKASDITKLPESHPAIAGLLLCRGEVITLIDLKYVLEREHINESEFKIIVCEFNKLKVAFYIDNIVGVHRFKWEQILKPDDISINPLIIGNILLDNKILLLLDFEKIVTDINPSTGISEERVVNVEFKDRSSIKVAIADDSPLIRRLLKDTLTKAGFKNLMLFDDGKQAYDFVMDSFDRKKENFTEDVQILITDIEMPQMDGFTLTRKLKEHPIIRKLPILIFSSLITGELKHKGESVGANAQLSKPEVGELVDIIDNYI